MSIRAFSITQLIESHWPRTFGRVTSVFCHNTYAAHVLDVVMQNGSPRVEKVVCALDYGIVINPDGTRNMAEGAIVDAIGNAMYGELTFMEGEPQKKNLDRYRLIRHNETPRSIEVHFAENTIDPPGLGESPFHPVFGALANALYKATGKRYYHQPFIKERPASAG